MAMYTVSPGTVYIPGPSDNDTANIKCREFKKIIG